MGTNYEVCGGGSGLDWDGWREGYDQMPWAEQQAYYAEVAERYPRQEHYSREVADNFFGRYRPRSVVELGGWDGSLARYVLEQPHAPEQWCNYDLVRVPQVCTAPGYQLHVLGRPLWEAGAVVADAFVATHVIEHIRAHELGRLVGCLRVRACLVEAPLRPEPQPWAGYCGTHILEVGWQGVDALFAGAGYQAAAEGGEWRYYERASST